MIIIVLISFRSLFSRAREIQLVFQTADDDDREKKLISYMEYYKTTSVLYTAF